MQMNEADILATTYWDRYGLYRRTRTQDPKTKQMIQSEVCIAEDLPCALSRNKSGETSFADQHGQARSSYTLFCASDNQIQEGDRLEVQTGSGQTFTLWVGRPFLYASHAEVPLSEEVRT